MGDLIPHVCPDHGPDQFGAWMGSELKFSPDNTLTNWAAPVLKDWESFLPVGLKEDNPVWQSVIKYSELLKKRGEGKYLVGVADLHSHMDAFSALRHPDALCMDLYDEPELVKQGLVQARAMYQPIYEKLYAVGGMSKETGTIGWLPLWCEGKTAAVQCDFSVFIGNDMWREFVLPGVAEEVNYLDHCFYHLDGAQQLIHLDDLLAIPHLDGIQWVPGAGQPEMFSHCWRDVLKKVLNAGKKVIVYGDMDLDVVKDVHNDIGAQGVVYDIWGQTYDEIQAIIKWLTDHT
jgi:5-methyltetrahydrofolate--homocysteine methyltransferase